MDRSGRIVAFAALAVAVAAALSCANDRTDCQLVACASDFADCDLDDACVCETPLTTITDCGGCGLVCATPNGTSGCSAGACTLVSCNPGFVDCDGDASNGCERLAAAIFSVFPDDLQNNVAGIFGPGHLGAASGHILGNNHMHITRNPTIGDQPLRAPASGTIFAILQGAPDDFQLYVKVTEELTYYFRHLTTLDPAISEAIPDDWWESLGSPYPRLVKMDDVTGVMPPRPGVVVTANDILGIKATNDLDWDFGVVDKTVENPFANWTKYRYPTLQDFGETLGILAATDWPFFGNWFVNAAPFPNYYCGELHAAITNQIDSSGRVAWDLPGTLQGAWFNPVLDDVFEAQGAPVPLNHEHAAVSIVRRDEDPSEYAIAMGHEMSMEPPTLAILAQTQAFPADLANTFWGAMTDTGKVNLDPALVGLQDLVAYELHVPGGDGDTHTLLAYLETVDTVFFKLVMHEGEMLSNAAADQAAAQAPPGDGWVAYVR